MAYDSFKGWKPPSQGVDSFEGWGVPEEVNKTIRWANNRWECEPFIVELFQVVNDERIPVNIDPKTVKLSDTKDWLEKDGEPVRGDDKKWQVPVKIKDSKLKDLVPEGYNTLFWKSPEFFVGKLPQTQDAPPQKKLSTILTVTVEIVSAAESAMGAATATALGSAGLAPVAAGAVSKLSQPSRDVISSPVNYIVEPPKPQWTTEQKKPVPLSGKGKEEIVTIKLSPMPEGWDSGLTVTCALPVEASKKRGLEIVSVQDTMSDASKGINTTSESTVQLGSPGEPGIFSGAVKPDQISADIRIKNSVCCFKKATRISDPSTPDKFLLLISTKNEYIGSQLEKTLFEIQPVEICIYLDKYPESEYPWDEKPVRVIRRGTSGVPERSRLPVSLHCTKEMEPDPGIVHWALADNTLDDGFSNSPGIRAEYHAPTQDSWEERDKIELRLFKCMVGPGDEEVVIEDDLCTTACLDSSIELKAPLGIARVLMSVRPSTFPTDPGSMILVDSKVYDSIHRKFFIDIDLQEISGNPQNAESNGIPVSGGNVR